MKKTLLLILAVVSLQASAAPVNYAKTLKKAHAVIVDYQTSYKGDIRPGTVGITICGDSVAIGSAATLSHRPSDNDAAKRVAPVTRQYIDYADTTYYQWAELPSGEIISSPRHFTLGKNLKHVGEDTWLGLPCEIVRTIINSNTIDIWFTRAIPFRGTPQPGVGVPDGLVLRVIRNGDQIQQAVDIRPLKQIPSNLFPETWGKQLEGYEYSYAINQSGVINVPVFDQDAIKFDGAKLAEDLKDGEIYRAAGGTVILKKVSLPEDIADRSVFLEVVQYSKGDAYDRTGSIFIIPEDRKQSFVDALHNLKSVPSFHSGETDYHGLTTTDEYMVPMELMRFFTGFGVRQFNYNKVPGQEWVDSVLYKTEVTSLADRLKGDVWVGAYIGNWDGNGHRLSLKFKYHPDGGHHQFRTLPLFNTVNYIEQAGQPYPLFMRGDSLTVTFDLAEPADNAVLYYLTTGHGGWGGGDEFNQKPNTISLDGERVISFVPWRDDCGTYRNNNPCSGNFANGLSSSDLSRSNWCPGTVTNPEYIYLGNLEAGKHTITVAIPQGAPQGGSNSYWCVSGTLLY